MTASLRATATFAVLKPAPLAIRRPQAFREEKLTCRVRTTLAASLTFVDFAGSHLDVENHAADVIDDGVLLERGFQPAVAAVRCHRRVGVGDADLLELPRLAAVASSPSYS